MTVTVSWPEKTRCGVTVPRNAGSFPLQVVHRIRISQQGKQVVSLAAARGLDPGQGSLAQSPVVIAFTEDHQAFFRIDVAQ